MADFPKLSPKSALVLEVIAQGQIYGYGIMLNTGLPSGTIYPILSRLEKEELILSRWEKRPASEQDQRPSRKYYRLTTKANKLLAADGKLEQFADQLTGGKAK